MSFSDEMHTMIAKRCEKALLENEEYLRAERSPDTNRDELQALAEVICYEQAMSDTYELLHILRKV